MLPHAPPPTRARPTRRPRIPTAHCTASSLPTSPASWPAPTPPCCWPTSAPRSSRSRAPPVTTPGTGCRRCATSVGTYYLAINRNKRSIALDLKDEDDLEGRPRPVRARRHLHPELQARRPRPLRPGLRRGRRPQPEERVLLHQRVRRRRRQGPARLRPARPGHVGTDEPDRRPRRPAVPRWHLRLRRDDRPALGHRHPRRASSPATTPARVSTSRPTCSPPPCRRWSTRPPPTSLATSSLTGWATPICPCSRTSRSPPATGTSSSSRATTASTASSSPSSEPPNSPTTNGSPPSGSRNDNREELRPLLLDLLSTKSAQEWFDQLTAAGIPCGPINDVQGGVELAERLGLEPVVDHRRRPDGPEPHPLLQDPRPLRPAPPAL